MILYDIFEALNLLEVLLKSDPIMFYNLIREVINQILTVMNHTLVEAVRVHIAGEWGLFGGLEDLPCLVQLTFDVFAPE